MSCDRLSRISARALSERLAEAVLQGIDVGEQVVLEVEQHQPRTRTHDGIRRHQLRMRKALVDVLVDDVGLGQDQVAFDQHRHFAAGADAGDFFRLVVHVDIDDFEVHVLFEQDNAAAVAVRTGVPEYKVIMAELPRCCVCCFDT